MSGFSATTRWAELDSSLAKLTSATNDLRKVSHADGSNTDTESRNFGIDHAASPEAQRARQSFLVSLDKLHMLVAEPADLLSQLAMQNQILACLHWLREFHVLALIPRVGSVPIQDIAELAKVPMLHLIRIVRMTASVGFLREPIPGHVEHTSLSAPFGNRPSYHDALAFLTNTAAPAAMQMVAATHRFRQQQQQREHQPQLHSPALDDIPPISSFAKHTIPRRQWPSFLRYALGDQDSSLESICESLDWSSLGNATIVDVGARSTSMASVLAEMYPSLKLVVQMDAAPERTVGLDSRIAIQSRDWGSPQTVRAASIYALRVPYDFPTAFCQTRSARLRAELEAHLDVLRDHDASRLVLTVRLSSHSDLVGEMQCGTERPKFEAAKSHVFDMSLLQLANDRELEVADLRELVQSVGDGVGSLVLEDSLHGSDALCDPAFNIRYQRGML